ncbi:MAG: galactokinase [Atopobiaceae bacterium]|jgi:galactokinase
MSYPSQARLREVYGPDCAQAHERLKKLEDRYAEVFGAASDLSFFSSPGRTELVGNHTDHNGGRILAASVSMDTVCAAAPSGTKTVTIISEGYPDPVVVDLTKLSEIQPGTGTTPLVTGILVAAKAKGWQLGGFNAVVMSEVPAGSGMSSSASFETLVCAVLNHLFNSAKKPLEEYALIGQSAENNFWNKASGLMDQMACAVGGTILLDFADGVAWERVNFTLEDVGMRLVFVNTGKSHADLSDEYSAIPLEMRKVAAALGHTQLSETNLNELLAHMPEVRHKVGCDRAIMRALHFFTECQRVDDAAAAVKAGDSERVLTAIRASGSSSWCWLQNAYPTGEKNVQPIPLALALSELYLARTGSGRGVCRLHGGGFGGVIMCVLPEDEVEGYVEEMAKTFGREHVFPTTIRSAGAVLL